MWSMLIGAQRELRSCDLRRTQHTVANNQSSSGVTSSASAVQLPVDKFQRQPQRFSASATRLYGNDCTSGDPWFGVSLRRRDVAHRGSLLSSAVLLAAGRSSCPSFFDDRSTRLPVSILRRCSCYVTNDQSEVCCWFYYPTWAVLAQKFSREGWHCPISPFIAESVLSVLRNRNNYELHIGLHFSS